MVNSLAMTVPSYKTDKLNSGYTGGRKRQLRAELAEDLSVVAIVPDGDY